MNYPAILSFFCGFISLSLEIVWVRLYGFSMFSTPAAFGFILMAYLAGIALGAWQGGKTCKKNPNNSYLWKVSTIALIFSAIATLTIPWVFLWSQSEFWRGPLTDFLLIAIVSCILAFIFPIAHHLGASPESGSQGQRFAWVYTSNVIGAALGPLVTGYILLNALTLQQVFVVLTALQLCAAGFFYSMQKTGVLRISIIFGATILGVVTVFIFEMQNPHAMIQKANANGLIASQVVENKYGIITIFKENNKNTHDDAVYGGNVYDGRTNLSLEVNSNGLHRPLLLAALQPKPRKVLMVGLSIGSWLALVNGFPGVEKIDVVEINAGYIKAAHEYPEQAKAIKDSRVKIVIDDARRWLRFHPENKYDLVIMNTTWHWRANTGFLLSREFLQIIKNHMNEGAVMAFNATGSPDAFYTASQVFKNAYRYDNFVYAAEFDFQSRKDSDEARDVYSKIEINGEKIFAEKSNLIDVFLNKQFINIEQDEKSAKRPLEIITDNNGLTEFKYGRTLNSMYMN